MFRNARARAAVFAAAVAVTAAAGGCSKSVTEIVLVVDSDLVVPDEIARVGVVLGGATAATDAGTEIRYDLTGQALPVTLGLLPGNAGQPFSVEVRGERADGGIVVRMAATGVRFVDSQNLMLELPLRRACACAQPDCPISSAPGCATLVAPVLPPFSPDAIPPHVTPDGGADAAGADSAGADAAGADAGGSDAGGADTGGADARAGDAAAPVDAPADGAGEAHGCTAGFGGCSSDCAPGTYCSSDGTCVAGTPRDLFCQVGGCTCGAGLACVASDGGAVGTCQ
jgi:hypothetical protein